MSPYQTQIALKVQPNAGRNEVAGCTAGVWRIKIAAPPDKGKANRELIEFLSRVLRVKKDSLSILRGQTSHNKFVAVEGLTAQEITARLGKENGHLQ
jgi:uncharacterized protein (TIGR00251 family)